MTVRTLKTAIGIIRNDNPGVTEKLMLREGCNYLPPITIIRIYIVNLIVSCNIAKKISFLGKHSK